MNIERLNQIEEIYHAALQIPLGERESFFDKTCGADGDLRREVESLLSFEKTSDSFLDNSPKSIIAEIFHEESNLIGKQINQYKVLSLLGEGGMGAVYLAQDAKLLRKVALKILSAEMVSEENRVQRFIHEARAASALNHPHILTIYDIGEVENLNFIAMEFVDGETFHESIYHGKTDLKTLLKYLAQTAEGLSKAHLSGIVHRDLKPENIMISRDGYAKILDFGLAKLVENEGILSQAQQHQSIKVVIM
ncbi:MAG TPA: serine/threonine-protein kinase, partial [Pyrinomonadaceae bacterium]|nr:serine/threonine-protein kinase [Pyrinomonadaceae bacterium]